MNDSYDLKSVPMPVVSGGLLKTIVTMLEGGLKGLVLSTLLKNVGVSWLRKQRFDEAPTTTPLYFTNLGSVRSVSESEPVWSQPKPSSSGALPTGILDLAQAYRSGAATPETVAARVLQSIEASQAGPVPLNAFIAVHADDLRTQAADSALRLKEGRPRSLLEGVPIAIKDQIDVRSYPTTVGTSFLGHTPAQDDATVVARLRQAGALIVGKTNMYEIGIDVSGWNPHHGAVRNPYDPALDSGGSSGGSAAAVAAGLVPAALGADGGGSIRVPAAFCGLVGLKPTFGRVSEQGSFPLDWSVTHIGPLATSATEAALVYATIAGPDPADVNSQHQPPVSWRGWDSTDLNGLRIGVYRPWFQHAHPEVVAPCEAMVAYLKSLGCTVHEVVIPNLEASRVAHAITIATEMAQAMNATYDQEHHGHGWGVRLSLALARQFRATDYVLAQRVRTRMMRHFERAFESVDVLLTPTTAIPPPRFKESTWPVGESNLSTTMEIMRFVSAANLTGLPAISFPAGFTLEGVPVGIQAIGRPWDELTLLRLARTAEQRVERRKPRIHFPLLG